MIKADLDNNYNTLNLYNCNESINESICDKLKY